MFFFIFVLINILIGRVVMIEGGVMELVSICVVWVSMFEDLKVKVCGCGIWYCYSYLWWKILLELVELFMFNKWFD